MPHPCGCEVRGGEGYGEQSRACREGELGAGGDWSHGGGRGGGGDALSRSSQGSSSSQGGARDKNRAGNRTGPGKHCAQQEPPPARHTVQVSRAPLWPPGKESWAGPVGVRTALRSPFGTSFKDFLVRVRAMSSER